MVFLKVIDHHSVCKPVKRRVTFSSASPSNDIDRARDYDVTKRLVCSLTSTGEKSAGKFGALQRGNQNQLCIKSEEGK